MMRIGFAFRDHFVRPSQVLQEIGVGQGQTVLDFGCGPGSYTLEAARLVGDDGTVYAADRNRLALQHVERRSGAAGLANVTTIHTDGKTDLPEASVDVALLFDVYHELDDPDTVQRELRRVLTRDGLLAFSDHHMDPESIEPALTRHELFRLHGVRARSYIFRPRL